MSRYENLAGYRVEDKSKDASGMFTCGGCDLLKTPNCLDANCFAGVRSDGREVIYKRIGPVMAIYATPCDDMGAHV